MKVKAGETMNFDIAGNDVVPIETEGPGVATFSARTQGATLLNGGNPFPLNQQLNTPGAYKLSRGPGSPDPSGYSVKII